MPDFILWFLMSTLGGILGSLITLIIMDGWLHFWFMKFRAWSKNPRRWDDEEPY